MSSKSLATRMKHRIYGHGKGALFSARDFLDLGSRAAIDMTLKRLSDEGVLKRSARGVYSFPKHHPDLGELKPTAEAVVRALAAKNRWRILASGAYAANLLGLSEQVPAKLTFLTDGPNRKIKVGHQVVNLRKTSPRNMEAADRVTGAVIQALKYLGKKNVDDRMIRRLRSRLSREHREQLFKDIALAPGWMGEIFRKLLTEEKK